METQEGLRLETKAFRNRLEYQAQASVTTKMPSVCGWLTCRGGVPSSPGPPGADGHCARDPEGTGVKSGGDPLSEMDWQPQLAPRPPGGKEAGRGLAERTLPFNYPLGLIGLPASPPAGRKRPLFAARLFTKQMVFKSFHRHTEPI